MVQLDNLAINGGNPVRNMSMPPRHLIGVEEKEILLKVVNRSIKTGDAFRYADEFEK